MARNFHPERTDPRGLQKNQRALEILLDQLFDSGGAIILEHDSLVGLGDDDHPQYALLSGRAGGQTILQGVTLEGGVTLNDLEVDVDFLVKALGGIVGLFVDGATGRVGVATVTPGEALEIAGTGTTRAKVKTTTGNAVFEMETNNSRWQFLGFGGTNQFSIFDVLAGATPFRILGNGNIGLNGGSFGSGVGVLFIGNRTTGPASNPAGGGILSIDAGVPKYIGPTGSESVVLTGADNLASLLSAATARTNLGLLSAALRDVGVGSDSEIPDRGLADARYALKDALSAPAGVRLLLGNNSVPSGWAIVASLADRTVMLTSTALEIDDLGGSWTTGITASTNVLGHALSVAELAAHTHDVAVEGGGGLATVIATVGSRAQTGTVSAAAKTTGDGDPHDHPATTTISSSSYRPAYYKAAFIQKS